MGWLICDMKYDICVNSGEDGFESGKAKGLCEMKWWEEAICILCFSLGVPGGGFCEF